MKRFILTSIVAIAAMCSARALDIEPTQLVYNVEWKWGLVDMQVGQGFLYLECDNDNLYGTFSGHSIPWEGRVYSVGDTLRAQLTPTAETISYVNGWYRKPRAGVDVDVNSPSHYRTIQGQGELSASSSTMEAIDITANMISIYYYARAIDFDSMQEGDSVMIPITNADGAQEKVEITFMGTSDKSKAEGVGEVYQITFNYSYHGTLSSYPVKCEIAKSTLTPVYMGADIKIGHVDMTLQ